MTQISAKELKAQLVSVARRIGFDSCRVAACHAPAHGNEFREWLQDGAHLYVCGDATRMAPDVESALLAVVRQHGGLNDDDARSYLLELQRARRYQRDVY